MFRFFCVATLVWFGSVSPFLWIEAKDYFVDNILNKYIAINIGLYVFVLYRPICIVSMGLPTAIGGFSLYGYFAFHFHSSYARQRFIYIILLNIGKRSKKQVIWTFSSRIL